MCLMNWKTIPKSHRSPYMNSEDVIQMKGRIDAAVGVSLIMKRPVILPNNHPLTHLLVDQFHRNYHHVHSETVVNELHYIEDPSSFKDIYILQILLYWHRLHHTDYCFNRSSKGEKMGLFITCLLTIRAIHTDSCIHSSSKLYCEARYTSKFIVTTDNGTNFHGVDNELRKINHPCLQEKFTSSAMKWIFNPPASPHIGGSWERLIRSVKKIFYQLNPSRILSDKLLRILFFLWNWDFNPESFYTGFQWRSKAVRVFQFNWISNGRSRITVIFFKRRWIREYLPKITRITKWFTNVKQIEKGDVVIIVDDNSLTKCWPKGVVIDVILGKNNQVRQATIQTSSGVLNRPAVKIAILGVK